MYKLFTFTRHALTSAQMLEIQNEATRFHLAGIEVEIHHLSELAKRNISSIKDAEEIWIEIRRLMGENHAILFGVVPVPLRHVMDWQKNHDDHGWTLEVRESFNVNRSKEGEKPSFEHNGWLKTGCYAY